MQPPAPRAPAVPSTQELANRIAERNRLVKAHEVFKRLVGTWDVEWTLQMGQGEPLHGTGVKMYSLLYGGRFLQWEGQDANSQHTSMGLIGYNTETKQYEATWVDTTHNQIWRGEGKFDEHTGVFTMNHPKSYDWGTYPMRKVEVWGLDGVMTSSMYGGSGGKEVLIAWSTSTRRPADASAERQEPPVSAYLSPGCREPWGPCQGEALVGHGFRFACP